MSTLQNADEIRAMTLTETGHNDEMKDICKNMEKKFSRRLVGFGAVQIIIGILCIVINGITLGMLFYSPLSSFIPILGHGFLPGLTFIVAGAIGLAAGKGKKKCQVISSNVLCIISASLCSYLFICSVIAASVARKRCYYNYFRSDAQMYTCYLQQDRAIALEAVLAILAFLEIGCAIGSSVVTCSIGACCCDCDCGCCCPPIMPQKVTGIPYQQPATFVLNPSQPTYYMPVANQMTIPSGQQQHVILLNPNQLMAQYNSQQDYTSSNVQTQETRGMNCSSTGEHEYEPLSLNTSKR